MPDRAYTITDTLLISAPDLTPKQADAFWLDLLELSDLHRVRLHGTRLIEVLDAKRKSLMKLLPQHLFKMLNADGTTPHRGHQWNLPRSPNVPGKWMPAIAGELVACANGYHVLRQHDLLAWMGPELWLAEWRGKRVDADDKVVVEQARLLHKVEAYNETNLRMFAADVAEHALMALPESSRDPRSINALAVVRAFANGEATADDLSAAWNSARNAALSAARNAARSSARSSAESAARSAALSAARNAAWNAAWNTARSSARSSAWSSAESSALNAARSSARSSAESAAESAARNAARSSARSSAESAAESAARNAAESAARNAEKKWQIARLQNYIGFELIDPESNLEALQQEG